jgi:hypothetical protein
MKTKVFLLLMLLSTTAWSQEKSGITLITESSAQTFLIDSVSNWGYDKSQKRVFVNAPGHSQTVSIPYSEFKSFEYPTITSNTNTVKDHLVIDVLSKKSSFPLDASFKMNWQNNVLTVQSQYHSQVIGLGPYIRMDTQKMTWGYVNPNISKTPQMSSKFYFKLWLKEKVGGFIIKHSFTDSYTCSVEGEAFILSSGSVTIRYAWKDIDYSTMSSTYEGELHN